MKDLGVVQCRKLVNEEKFSHRFTCTSIDSVFDQLRDYLINLSVHTDNCIFDFSIEGYIFRVRYLELDKDKGDEDPWKMS